MGSFELRGVELSERERETSSLGGEEEEEEEGRPLEERTLRQSDSRPRGRQALPERHNVDTPIDSWSPLTLLFLTQSKTNTGKIFSSQPEPEQPISFSLTWLD